MASDAHAQAPSSPIAGRLVRAWYAASLTPLTLALTPLAGLFASAVTLRRWLFRLGWRRAPPLPVPVVVVGNITAGGTGKTPLVIALARSLAARGWHPGVVSRGFGAAKLSEARVVRAEDAADEVGDEPLLIARAGIPIAIGSRRVDAAIALLRAQPSCDIVVSDDGLQHYALGRDVEIAVIDGVRGFGNGWLLPAGPLREPVRRLREVDAIVVHGGGPDRLPLPAKPIARMHLAGESFVNLRDPTRHAGAGEFAGQRVHAIAGIGDPERFFAGLRALGVDVVAHAFPDHHRFAAVDLARLEGDAILMTEKDAVKCERFADARCWMLPVRAVVDDAFFDTVSQALARSSHRAMRARR